MVLDPPTGEVVFANAGHNLPYVRGVDGSVRELRATGMPLGLMPGLTYEQSTAIIQPGEHLLLYSDGLCEQHDGTGEMFGFPRTSEVVAASTSGQDLVDRCVSELARFTGPGVEQEDDITLVALERRALAALATPAHRGPLARFELRSEEGNERAAMDRVLAAVAGCGLSPDQMQRLGTAVAEAAMSASYEVETVEGRRLSVVTLHGQVDRGAMAGLTAAYQEAAASDPTTVVLDFTAVDYINSTGIALIVGLLGQARAEGRHVAATGLSEHYRHVFTITRLSDFIDVYDDVESAAADAQVG
jgi:anti-anti-sigma factor